MITVATSIMINVPPEKVFQFLLSPQKVAGTLPSFMDIIITRKDFHGPGSMMHWVLKKKDGTVIEWDEEYVAYKENELLCWRTSNGPLWIGEYRLYKVTGGTFLVMVESTDYFDSAKIAEKVIKE
ncbi:MAG: SRPBCC family protein, partial [Candidatus Ranarchaeia archaeon]